MCKTLNQVVREHVTFVLKKHDNKKTAAQELGISFKTIYNMLDRWKREDEGKSKK